MSAIDRERLRCEDTCPVCGEGIDWEAGDHELLSHGEFVYCWLRKQCYDAAVLDMQHLND